MKRIVRIAVCSLVVFCLGCGGRMPEGMGANHGMLSACPDKPNCVSSFAEDEEHQIAAIQLADAPAAGWAGLRSILEEDASVEIVTSGDDYIHAVYTSSIMRYRDDVEFILFADDGQIAIRSASRVGHSDMGVNRERIETIRSHLAEQGLGRAAGSN